MKSLGRLSSAVLGLSCALFLSSCGTSDGDEPHDARGGSSTGGEGGMTGGGSGGTAGSGGQPSSGGTSGAATGGAPSGGAAGSGVAGAGTSGGRGGQAMGGMSGSGAGRGGSGGASGGRSGAGGAPGGWTCENLGAEICFCRLGGDPLMGTSCTGSWNCCFVTGTAERGNCQCFDTASDAECTDTVASVTGTRAQACPP